MSVFFFFFFFWQAGFGSNRYARRKVGNYFKANYDSVRFFFLFFPFFFSPLGDGHDTHCNQVANPIILCAIEKQLIKRYPDGNGLNYLVKGSFASLSSRKDLEDVKAFFETKGEFFLPHISSLFFGWMTKCNMKISASSSLPLLRLATPSKLLLIGLRGIPRMWKR